MPELEELFHVLGKQGGWSDHRVKGWRATKQEIVAMVTQSGIDPEQGLGVGELVALLIPPKSIVWKLLLGRLAELSQVFGVLCQVESSGVSTRKKKEKEHEKGEQEEQEEADQLTTTPWPKQRIEDELSVVFSLDHMQDLVKAHLMVSSIRFTGERALVRGPERERERES